MVAPLNNFQGPMTNIIYIYIKNAHPVLQITFGVTAGGPLCPRCTYHDFNSAVVVFEQFVSVSFVVHTVRVVVDSMTTKTNSCSTVVLYGIEAKYVAAAASVKACLQLAS